MGLSLGQQLSFHYDKICQLLESYGGILINENSYAFEAMLVIRMNPDFLANFTAGLVNLGFILGNIRISGWQMYIRVRGYMY